MEQDDSGIALSRWCWYSGFPHGF